MWKGHSIQKVSQQIQSDPSNMNLDGGHKTLDGGSSIVKHEDLFTLM